ncbi:MAG: LPS export ABC transporter periplasmic protein LptC [Cyanobacteria bacterium J06626_14]
MGRRYWWALGVLIVGGVLALSARLLLTPEFSADYIPEDQQEELEAGLTLRDVTLEQQDDDGQLLWRVDADEVTYSPDQESANLVRLEGELYQDGELIYRVKADRGQIQENGQIIFLEQNIFANGIQNKMELTGDALEWRPEEDFMLVQGNLTGTHPQIRAQANEARISNREKRVDFTGEVVVSTVVSEPQQEPWTKLQANTMQWLWEAEELGSNQPLRVERFENNRVTEVLNGQKGRFELAENRATVTDGVQVQLIEVPLTIQSEQAVWNVEQENIQVDRPVRIDNQEEKVTVTAQQGQLDIAQNLVFLNQDVSLVGQENDSRLNANRLTWNLADQTVLAEGAVNYRQSDPPVTVRGPRARGRIEEQTVVIDGGRVVTEIVPNIE